MLTSHEAISSGVAAFPRWGPSANATPCQVKRAAQAASSVLRVDMFDLAALHDPPARNSVEVVSTSTTTLGNQPGARRLHISGIVGGAALKHRGAAVPSPRQAETRDRHRKHRPLQR